MGFIIFNISKKDFMKLAVDYYPFLKYYHGGPKVFLKRLVDSIHKQKITSVYSPFFPFYEVALFSVYNKSIYNKKYVLRVDGIYFDILNTYGNTDFLNKKIFDSIDKAEGIVFISEFSKKIVERFHGKIDKPNIVIHNKVPLNIFTSSGNNYRSKLNFKKTDKVLITSAHWRRHKRLEETIELLNHLNKNNNEFKLIVLGGEKKNLSNKNIIFAGEISPEKLGDWYRTADLYIHLAWIEPCGNTQIEAMACGLPVICCNNGGIGETVNLSSGGIIVDADLDYQFNKLDYYKPPKPNYKNLVEAVNTIFSNYDVYKDNINYNYLNIDNAAIEYTNFIKKLI